MTIFSWGNYPKTINTVLYFKTLTGLKSILNNYRDLIPIGNARSYGDSALNKHIINIKSHNYFLDFDSENGYLHVQAGVLISEILNVIIPKGWFLEITPGTKLITIGGAIASDVHGKNHHIAGCFSECLELFNLMLPSGEIITCSNKQNSELFHATCGGMGLTGVILDAKINLKKINSKYIQQTTIKTSNLTETFAAFDKYQNTAYSVAWIDCMATDKQLGKSLLMVGDFCDDGNLGYQSKTRINIPIYFPAIVLNKFTVKIFNYWYYQRINSKVSKQKVEIDSFFYPLDSIKNWNRIYGKDGFIQYQFILPKATSFNGLKAILKLIAESKKGSFLAVLKLYGKENANYLSFPLAGYSLALDFKIEIGIFKFLDQLDKIVLQYNGRIYLAKDARVSKKVFQQGYPQINKFKAIRKKYRMNLSLNSKQSERIGL